MGLQVGDAVGEYRILGVLGSCGMGRVFRVEHRITRRTEAMKVLLESQSDDPALAQRFLREIQLQASLHHPNIASVYSAFSVGDDLFLVMELVEGESLERRLERGRIPLQEGIDYSLQALAALRYAHAHGVTHRDVKPANLIATPEGVLKLTDFGLAKAGQAGRLSASGAPMGSVYYMSPEQVMGSVEADARSDIYSLGTVLYELATGRKPFDAEGAFEVMRAHIEDAPAPPIEKEPSLPPALSDAILKALEKRREDRFQSAEEFREGLERVGRSAPPLRRRPVPFPEFRFLRIGALAAALAAAAVLLGPRRRPATPVRVAEPARTELKAGKDSPRLIPVPAGTMLKVRLRQEISSSVNKAGETFTATLEEPLAAANRLTAPKGATVEGRITEAEKGGRLKGRARLAIELTRLRTANGEAVRITTGLVEREGSGARLVARGAPATFPARAELTFRLTRPIAVNAGATAPLSPRSSLPAAK
jgi:serine/threonine-protein kinase